MKFYNQHIDEIFAGLNTAKDGLTNIEAENRLKINGANRLESKKQKSAIAIFLLQFKDFMILVLLAAAVVSIIIGDSTDAAIIVLIILLNAIFGFYQEFKAEKSMEALRKMAAINCKVIRNGAEQIIDAEHLVVGDIILLEAGNIVPADIRLISCTGLYIDESTLTGESLSVNKISNAINDDNLNLADLTNMAFKTTLVTEGKAQGVVVATGMKTEVGKIASLIDSETQTTSLQILMKNFSTRISYLILVICSVVMVLLYFKTNNILDALLVALSLAVAAIPESLPALITIALARGAWRMAQKSALVRRLSAVETLGSVSHICTDKTGTLTKNNMAVVNHKSLSQLTFQGIGVFNLAQALNNNISFNNKQQPIGNATEVALINHQLQQNGLNTITQIQNNFERVAEIPFSSERKKMTSVYQVGSDYLVLTKGAIEMVGELCTNQDDVKEYLLEASGWAKEGLRVLAFAYKLHHTMPDKLALENDLSFLGMVALADEVRPEAQKAVADCKKAGIEVVMITGDHKDTAVAIANKIGIWQDDALALTGAELNKLAKDEFEKIVSKIKVYARVTPEQKLTIVKALQNKKYFVAMTGDGVNDAPALKAANIGVAMGINGTDVSKQAASMILLDDNFATIVKAVKEGRKIYDNITKFICYILSGNLGEILTIVFALILGFPIPLLPIHILWVNLVTDGLPGIALATLPAESELMKHKPTNTQKSILTRELNLQVLLSGFVIAVCCIVTQYIGLKNNYAYWQTMVFLVLCFSQMANVLSIASNKLFFKIKPGKYITLFASVLLTLVLQILITYLPVLNNVFHTNPIPIKHFVLCVLASAVIFVVLEAKKLISKKNVGI